MSGFESVVIPEDIVAGDIINIEYTGEIFTKMEYPGTTSLYNGEVISYSFEYATTIHYYLNETNSIETIKSRYEFDNAYVILDRSGAYVSLDEYAGSEIYLVVDQIKDKIIPGYVNPDLDDETPDKIIPIACMLAYNPRDIEDGQVEHNITEAEAIEIAMEAFYQRDNFLPEGFEYKPRIIKGNNPAYYYVISDVEYVGEDTEKPDILFNYFTFTCIIDKETGEIIKTEADY